MTNSKGNAPRDYLYRKGKYIYFRHPTTKALTPLPRDEASDAFEAAYGPLLRAVLGANDPAPAKPPACTIAKPFDPGTIGFFGVEFRRLSLPKLANETQRTYRKILDDMAAHKIGRAMLHDVTPRIVDIYSTEIARTLAPSTADRHVTMLANLWQLARGYECFKRGDKHDPTIGRLKHFEPDPDGHLVWPDDVIDKFDGWAAPHLVQYRMGLHYTGQRGGDVVKMKWSDYQSGKINVVQEKTGAKISIPCPAKLKAMLDAMPRRGEWIFTNSRGQRYASANTLSKALHFQLKACGFTDYSMHGLRKNAGVALAMAGCTVNEIMTVLGHETPAMAIFYCKQADKIRLAETAITKLDAHHAREDAAKAEAKRERIQSRRSAIKAVS
jgi:integrase